MYQCIVRMNNKTVFQANKFMEFFRNVGSTKITKRKFPKQIKPKISSSNQLRYV